MPFNPSPIDFFRTDSGRLARFYDEREGPREWNVDAASVGGNSVKKDRWKFENVNRDPGAPGWMQGTLVFVGTGFPAPGDVADKTLDDAWNTGTATLELNVKCRDYSRPLSVRLKK